MCERCADLELENRVLRAERDMLLLQREGTQEWLGALIHGSPIDPMNGSPDPNRVLADRLVEEYPDKKIQAIKELRTRSGTTGPDGGCLGLKQAKDYIDAAYARAEQRKKDYQDNLPF
jgi:hypothetical protein